MILLFQLTKKHTYQESNWTLSADTVNKVPSPRKPSKCSISSFSHFDSTNNIRYRSRNSMYSTECTIFYRNAARTSYNYTSASSNCFERESRASETECSYFFRV